MFGQNDMLGNEDRKVDDKSRIILPDFCKSAKDDIVVVLSMNDYIEVWGLSAILERLEQTRVDDFTYSDEVTAFIALTEVKVDIDRRINLTKKLVEDYQLQEGAHIEGKGRFIRIWNQNRYLDYKGKEERKVKMRRSI